jgi:hypothetical protein
VNPVWLLAFGAAALCLVFSGNAHAQTWNKRTTVTFKGPVEIPGVGAQVLPAGTYVFKLLDSASDRHVVQVFNRDESHVYATILAIPNYRLKSTDKTVITFAERPAGEPQAIRAWFYPGDNWGQEFVYPRSRAVELAKLTNQPVLYIPDDVAPNLVAPVKTATEAPVRALRAVELRAVDPVGTDVALTQVVEAPPVLVAGLPRTAGNLPLLALMGLLSLALGYSLKPSCAR